MVLIIRKMGGGKKYFLKVFNFLGELRLGILLTMI